MGAKGLLYFLAMSSIAFSISNDFFNDSKRGWHYYEKEPITKEEKQEEVINQKETINKETKKEKRELDDEAFMKSIPLNALNSLTVKEYTETFDRVKSIATMKPTKENVKILQAMNKWQTEQSERFAKVWAINLLEDPNLEFPNISNDKFGRTNKGMMAKAETQKFFEEKKDKLSFVVFYSARDQKGSYNQKAIYDLVEKDYGIKTYYVDLDSNPDLIEKFKLTALPENFFLYKNSKGEGVWHRIKAGFANMDVILDTTQFLFDNAILEEDK